MNARLHPTSKTVEVDVLCECGCGRVVHVPARVWEGWTDEGVPFAALVTLVAVERGHDQAAFQAALTELRPPGRASEAFPMRMVL